MSLASQVSALQTQVTNLQAMIQSIRYQGLFYSMIGSHCVFGCKVTAGSSSSDMVLALDGEASGDSAHLNPDGSDTPVRPEQYWNIANVYGEVFLRNNVNTSTLQDSALTVSTAPGTGYHRYDIVYAYCTNAGPACGIVAGVAVLNASTPADPALPQGTLALARVHVQANVTGIANADITDLRTFSGRLRGETGAGGAAGPVGLPVYLDAEAGEEGPPGLGIQGIQGLTGAQGPTGPATYLEGDQGEEGPPGLDIPVPGPEGPQGNIGLQGSPGVPIYLEAPEGEDGPPGLGVAGPQGPTGSTGSTGPVGPAVFLEAEPGDEGPMGAPGIGAPSNYLISGGALGTPASGALTNCTGLPITGISDYLTGSYTGTLTGCTTSPTIVIYYTKTGAGVILNSHNAALQAVSNTTGCTVTGAPVGIRPAHDSQMPVVECINGSASTWALQYMNTGGTIVAYQQGGNWTASGQKGFEYGIVGVYSTE